MSSKRPLWLRAVPALGWLRSYQRADFRGDLVGGLTTAVMLIPQGMAYAMLAGLPPIVGLYASVVPLAVYALFGSSRQLAVGPVAMVSLLVATGVGAMVPEGGAGAQQTYVGLAVMLAAVVGALQLVMGLARAGFLTNFLSHPVVSGFTSAAALIIGLSQLKHLLGVDLARSHHIHQILIEALRHGSDIDPTTLGIGIAAVALLVGLRRISPMIPSALVVVVLGTLAVWLLRLDQRGVAIVGHVPAGIPAPALPAIGWAALRGLLPTALAISFVGFMESISVAKAMASRHGYEVDANQELIGLGLANIGGSLFGAYPVTGGFSRTAVNDQAGARTGLASLITAGVIALALLFFTPVFYFLPNAVLAAIIMSAVFGLIDVAEVRHLYRVKRSDLALLAITFVATLSLGIEEGILVGVGASLLWFVVRTTRPHTAVLGRLPGTEVYRNVANYQQAERTPGVLVLRVDAQFYFGNVSFLKETLNRLETEASPPLRAVVIEAASMNQLDSSAATALLEIARDYRDRGITLLFASTKRPVYTVMQRAGLVDLLGQDAFFFRVHEAMQSLPGD